MFDLSYFPEDPPSRSMITVDEHIYFNLPIVNGALIRVMAGNKFLEISEKFISVDGVSLSEGKFFESCFWVGWTIVFNDVAGVHLSDDVLSILHLGNALE